MKHAPAGFTLLEVLVALVVLGLVLGGLVQGTRFGLRVADRQAATIAGSADLDATERALRGLVGQMDPGSLTSAPLLLAGAGSLAFTTDLSVVAPSLGVGEADVGLGVTPDHRLVLRWTPHLHATRLSAPPASNETTLLPGVERLQIRLLLRRRRAMARRVDGAHAAVADPHPVRLRAALRPRLAAHRGGTGADAAEWMTRRIDRIRFSAVAGYSYIVSVDVRG